jgi:hypothetical protein
MERAKQVARKVGGLNWLRIVSSYGAVVLAVLTLRVFLPGIRIDLGEGRWMELAEDRVQ